MATRFTRLSLRLKCVCDRCIRNKD